MRLAPALAALAILPGALSAETGAAFADAFVAGETGLLWEAMDPAMRAALGGAGALADLRAALAGQAGEEVEVLSRETSPSPLGDIHDRVSRWSRLDAPLAVKVVTDAGGRIAGFWVGPAPVAAESRFLDYDLEADLRLPFDGEWLVFWGGRSLTGNYHAADRAQRFALDLVVVRDGATFAGDPADPASYHCWDRPVLAPGDGRVAAVVDGLPDQPIGEMDPANPAGNHVVIDLGHDEYVFLAHLREDSVAVAPGQQIAAGEEIGRCGNSGNSSEPHLHLHLQTTPDLATGEGLPGEFTGYLADGLPVARGEPERGQTVAPAE